MNTIIPHIQAAILNTSSIGGMLLLFVGLVICCAITYAIMRATEAPPWLYKVAAVAGLVLLLIFCIIFFFGSDVSIRSPVR